MIGSLHGLLVILTVTRVHALQSWGDAERLQVKTDRYDVTKIATKYSSKEELIVGHYAAKPTFPVSSIQQRRGFVGSSLLFAWGTLFGGQVVIPRSAKAADAESANIELPNYIEFLIEKNTLPDPDKFLYKGADPQVQLQRLLDASKRLQEIPGLAADKKWSQVQGVLTGPLGNFTQTLNLVSKDSTADVQAVARKIKADIFDISLAASKKSDIGVVAKTKSTLVDLEAFIKLAF